MSESSAHAASSLADRAVELARRWILEAAEEEVDHLAWCEQRIRELGSHPSVLNPLFYGMSFGIGALAGLVGGASSNLAIDNSAKLNFLGTGTSLIAGQTLSTTDDRWLSHVGAEQKLFGGVSITGSISETAEGFAERSLKAGYKYRW